jgi:hypothetical protein
MIERKELAHYENLGRGRGYHHNRIDVDVVVADTADVNEDPMALYLVYYD